MNRLANYSLFLITVKAQSYTTVVYRFIWRPPLLSGGTGSAAAGPVTTCLSCSSSSTGAALVPARRVECWQRSARSAPKGCQRRPVVGSTGPVGRLEYSQLVPHTPAAPVPPAAGPSPRPARCRPEPPYCTRSARAERRPGGGYFLRVRLSRGADGVVSRPRRAPAPS